MFPRSFAVFLFAIAFLTVGGCKAEWQTAPPERFRLVVTQGGRALRLDTHSGEIALITDKGLIVLPVTTTIESSSNNTQNGTAVDYYKKYGLTPEQGK